MHVPVPVGEDKKDASLSEHELSQPATRRPNGVQDAAAAFACAVTAPSLSDDDWVARNGNDSLFNLFCRVLPQACYDGSRNKPLKGKIGKMEFNKLLQSRCGFTTARSRKKCVASAGHWLFSHRRLLDPSRRSDRIILERGFVDLTSAYPIFEDCDQAHFMQGISDAFLSWRKVTGRKHKRSKSSPALGCDESATPQSEAHASSDLLAASTASECIEGSGHTGSGLQQNREQQGVLAPSKGRFSRTRSKSHTSFTVLCQHKCAVSSANIEQPTPASATPASAMVQTQSEVCPMNAGQLIDVILLNFASDGACVDTSDIERFVQVECIRTPMT